MATTSSAKGGTMKTKGTKQGAVKGGVKTAKKSVAKAAKGAAKTAKRAAKTTKGAAKTSKGAAKAAKSSSRAKSAAKSTAKAEAKVRAAARAAAEASVDVMDEPPPSLLGRPIRRLAWGYALLKEMGDDVMNDFEVEAGTKVAIEGEVERLAYVYVVQIAAEDRSIEVLYPPKGGARRIRPGTRMRIPGGSGWIVTTKKGRLRTIASSYPITDMSTAGID